MAEPVDDRGVRPGPLIIIGGAEDREGERGILRVFAEQIAGRKAVVATVATEHPHEYAEMYEKAFSGLGIGELAVLHLDDRSQALDPEHVAILDGAAGVFFTGGAQSRISSKVSDTPVHDRIRELWQAGGVLAGTSAGASVMSDVMLVGGTGRASHRMGDLHLAPGLGILRDVVIDQHFAERGRFGRLIGVVAHSPHVLGIGIDEDTAIVARGGEFEVIGSGAVYVFDAAHATSSNVAEARPDDPVSLHDLTLHVLARGDRFDMASRRPQRTSAPRA
ncbi:MULTISPECIES: cyanophycinase [unclassified Salinibacterium]|uniref:cyanophycinase n=1 Tax=unclassified Salinibacterium TaxID=2632331 RepID=UPI001424A6FF|nr:MULTISPECIES: cyanophycinase [unclassified Salinibacterium]